MKPAALVLALLALAGSAIAGPDPQAVADAQQKSGTALAVLPAPSSPGEQLFDRNCAICHAAGELYPGYLALQQHGAAVPELAKRTDLTADYVKTVVRNGIGIMPAFTPTLMPEGDVALIAAYLARTR